MHVNSLEDQTHMCTHASLGWSPTLFSPVFFYSGRPAVVVCMANRAKAEGHGWGTSLLKGSCNFHSRVLLKLVLRPQPIRAPSCPPTLSVPLQPNFPLSAAAAGQLAVLFQSPSFTCICLCGFVSFWSSKPLVLNKQESHGCLKILIIVVDMVSIFFTHIIHRWVSLPLPLPKSLK